ncbi:hypothetical protein KJZ99_00995 [bacterium]|nr:hypothetical protein [bacterium]
MTKPDIYMLGIGGIAMANVAVLLREAGYAVSGSDQNIYEPAASILSRAGVSVRTPYAVQNVPNEENSIVVVGNVQSRGQIEVEEALSKNIPLESFPGLLRRTVMRHKRRIVVAGTHGKSTTTACIAHLLKSTGHDPSYLIGADPLDLDFGGHYSNSDTFVIEGDEYDSAFFDKRSKFLDYFPSILVLGRVEHDHLDIFPTLDEMLLSYRRLVSQLPGNGRLIVSSDSLHAMKLAELSPCEVVTVGFSETCTWQIRGTDLVHLGDQVFATYADSVLGSHNRLNVAMAIASASAVEPDLLALVEASKQFRGIRRRLELVLRAGEVTVFDDFAHHPTAVAAAIDAVREYDRDARVIAVFEPRSNTATRDLYQHEFAEALAKADAVVIGSIHRKERISSGERLNVDAIVEQLTSRGVAAAAIENSEIPDYLHATFPAGDRIVLFMSNGSFDGVCHKFCKLFLQEN